MLLNFTFLVVLYIHFLALSCSRTVSDDEFDSLESFDSNCYLDPIIDDVIKRLDRHTKNTKLEIFDKTVLEDGGDNKNRKTSEPKVSKNLQPGLDFGDIGVEKKDDKKTVKISTGA